MALAQTKKIAIYGLQSERKRCLKVLQDSGLLELIVSNPDQSEESAAFNRITVELQTNFAELDRKIAAIVKGLTFLDQYLPVKPNIVQQFAGIKTYLTPEEFGQIAQDEERCQQVLTELTRLEQELGRVQIKRTQLQTIAENLRPWRELDLCYAGVQGTAAIRVTTGITGHSLTELVMSLSEMEFPFHLEKVGEAGNNLLFVLFSPARAREAVQTIFNRLNVNQVVLPEFETTVAARLEQIQQELTKLEQDEAVLREETRSKAETRPVLQVFYDHLSNERNRLEVTAQLLHQKRSFMLSGWVAADRLDALEESLNKAKLKYVLTPVEPEEGEQPPAILRNNKAVTPFEYLVQSFSYPGPTEIDPTPSIAPFFFIFFGIALGDVGYGVILALICALFLVKLKLGPVGKKISWMFLLSGIAAAIFGLMTGSVMCLQNLKFGLFNPLQNPILLLVIALGLGLIQLYYGILISAFLTIRDGRWREAVANQGTLLFFLTSVLLVLGKDTLGWQAYATNLNYLLLTAAAAMVLGNMYGKKGFVAKLLAIPGGLYSIYNTIGFFSDVLSYSRLMALGLSTGVMGGIMNQLGGQVFNSIPVLGWIFGAFIFIFGHALNFALSILSAYVHSSRLQYLEFFGKFYGGGGRPFVPFINKFKYTFLVNKKEA
jgi:V/A-type H+-transporting ATPase subunit I